MNQSGIGSLGPATTQMAKQFGSPESILRECHELFLALLENDDLGFPPEVWQKITVTMHRARIMAGAEAGEESPLESEKIVVRIGGMSEKLKQAARREDTTASAIIRRLVANFLGIEVPILPPNGIHTLTKEQKSEIGKKGARMRWSKEAREANEQQKRQL